MRQAGFGDYKAAVVLVLVVVMNAMIGFLQERKAENALQSLCSLAVSKATVVRDGKKELIDASRLVPGDIVHIDEGSQVPADMRLIHAVNLACMESILTGESLPSEKHVDVVARGRRSRRLSSNKMQATPDAEVISATKHTDSQRVPLGDQYNMAFMSTVVSRGHGVGVVVSTGYMTGTLVWAGGWVGGARGSRCCPCPRVSHGLNHGDGI